MTRIQTKMNPRKPRLTSAMNVTEKDEIQTMNKRMSAPNRTGAYKRHALQHARKQLRTLDSKHRSEWLPGQTAHTCVQTRSKKFQHGETVDSQQCLQKGGNKDFRIANTTCGTQANGSTPWRPQSICANTATASSNRLDHARV